MKYAYYDIARALLLAAIVLAIIALATDAYETEPDEFDVRVRYLDEGTEVSWASTERSYIIFVGYFNGTTISFHGSTAGPIQGEDGRTTVLLPRPESAHPGVGAATTRFFIVREI